MEPVNNLRKLTTWIKIATQKPTKKAKFLTRFSLA